MMQEAAEEEEPLAVTYGIAETGAARTGACPPWWVWWRWVPDAASFPVRECVRGASLRRAITLYLYVRRGVLTRDLLSPH